MSVSTQPRNRLVVAEKAIYCRNVRRHSISLPSEPVESLQSAPLDPVDSAEKARQLLGRLFEQKPVEGLYAIALNCSGDFLGLLKVSEGTVDRTAVYPRELVTFLLIEANATGLLLAHSHPGGRNEPSSEDLALTRRLKDLLQPLGVKLLDHLIYAFGRPGRAPEWISLRERGDL